MSLLPLADDLRLELEARTAEERNASAKAAPITHLARRSLRPAGHGGGARGGSMKPAGTSHDTRGLSPQCNPDPYRLTDRVLHAAGITAALLTGAVAIVLWWPR